GYLNVRSQPTTADGIIGTVTPGETYVYTEERGGWYHIVLPDGTSGWVIGQYVKVLSE
ncbi:SH3 domain-containing protein, partial [Patescibacteria group bacterium]